MSVGVDSIDVAALKKRGIKLGHTPGVLTDAVVSGFYQYFLYFLNCIHGHIIFAMSLDSTEIYE